MGLVQIAPEVKITWKLPARGYCLTACHKLYLLALAAFTNDLKQIRILVPLHPPARQWRREVEDGPIVQVPALWKPRGTAYRVSFFSKAGKLRDHKYSSIN